MRDNICFFSDLVGFKNGLHSSYGLYGFTKNEVSDI